MLEIWKLSWVLYVGGVHVAPWDAKLSKKSSLHILFSPREMINFHMQIPTKNMA